MKTQSTEGEIQLDIKKQLQEVIDGADVPYMYHLKVEQLCRNALAEIVRLEHAVENEVERQGNLMEFYSKQDVGTGLHRLADLAEKLVESYLRHR